MRKVLIVTVAALSLLSCKKEELTFKTKKFHKEIVQNNDTTAIDLEVAVAQNKSAAADSINALFLKEITFIFSFDSAATVKNYPAVCSDFIKEYVSFQKEMPDYSTPWEATASGKIGYHSDKVINLTLDYYSFTGGAHGNGRSLSYFVDPETGKQIKKEDLFTDVKGFTKLAEQKFRIQQEVPAQSNINKTGYWFEKDRFHLPENIFYTDKGILLLYNQYEIASYADGPIELTISFSEADKFLQLK